MLHQNFPNPFNPATAVEFNLPHACRVSVEIFDVTGRLITTLLDGELTEGEHSLRWDGTDSSGRAVRSGVYFCRLRAGSEIAARKMVLIE
jgi:flagellar hook assembly protein FlgD